MTAYPIILQMPMDNEGYRYINFMPLVEIQNKPPTGLAIVHRNIIHQFDDLIVKEYEIGEDDEGALTLCLSNMLCGTRYLYTPMSQNDLEVEYECLAKSICYLMLRLASTTNSQKAFLSALYAVFHRFLPVLNLAQREIMDFMEVLDTIVEETIDENGIITVESITKAMETIGSEDEQKTQVDVSDLRFDSDEDASFFAGLFA